jgi:hypothetical protein
MYRTDKAFEGLDKLIKESPDTVIAPEVKREITEKVKETKETLRSPLDTDKWIYRIVVGFLGLAILASLIFTFFLSVGSANPQELKIPDIFLAIGSAAVGALAGLLAPSPGRGSNE